MQDLQQKNIYLFLLAAGARFAAEGGPARPPFAPGVPEGGRGQSVPGGGRGWRHAVLGTPPASQLVCGWGLFFFYFGLRWNFLGLNNPKNAYKKRLYICAFFVLNTAGGRYNWFARQVFFLQIFEVFTVFSSFICQIFLSFTLLGVALTDLDWWCFLYSCVPDWQDRFFFRIF